MSADGSHNLPVRMVTRYCSIISCHRSNRTSFCLTFPKYRYDRWRVQTCQQLDGIFPSHLPCSNFTPTFRCSLTWDYDWYTCCWCTMRCQAKMPESPRTIPNRSPQRLNDKPVRASGYPEVNIADACIPLNHCNAAVRREMFSFNFSLVERLCHSCKVTWLDLLRSTASTLRRSATTLGA